MAVTYKKPFQMIDRNISNSELITQTGCSANIITKLKRDNYLALDTLEKICKALHCGVDDILEFTKEPAERGDN